MIVELGKVWLDRSNRRIEIYDRQPPQLFCLDVTGDHKTESERLQDYEAVSVALNLGAVLKQETRALESAHRAISHDPSVASSLCC